MCQDFSVASLTMSDEPRLRSASVFLKITLGEYVMRWYLTVLLRLACGFAVTTSVFAMDGAPAETRTIAGNGQTGPFQAVGPSESVAVNQPFGICMGPDGALYVCEVGQHVVRRIDPASGLMTTVAGNGRKGYSGDGGPATEAQLNEPYEVRFDSAGHMHFVEMQNHIVRRVDKETAVISTVAGTGFDGFGGDGAAAINAALNRPHSIAFDAADNLYICDIGNHRIRKVESRTGMITTWGGTGERRPTPDGAPVSGTPLNGPRALDYDGKGSLFLALREGNSIWRIDLQEARLHHIAGTGESGYSGDGGPAIAAALSGPKGIAVSRAGDVYFADTESHTVRVVRNADGIIETVIGDGQRGDGPDGPASACRMDRPHGVFVSADHKPYVGDSNNHRVRRLNLAAPQPPD